IHFGDRALHRGMQGRDVKVLQRYLTQLGVDTTVDGQYGPTTTRHVMTWERSASFKADGRVSRPHAAALKAQIATGASALQDANGGAAPVAPAAPVVAPDNATLGPDGLAVAPADAPVEVQEGIAPA